MGEQAAIHAPGCTQGHAPREATLTAEIDIDPQPSAVLILAALDL